MQLDRAFLSDPENRCVCKRFICGENKHVCLKCSENELKNVIKKSLYIQIKMTYTYVYISLCVCSERGSVCGWRTRSDAAGADTGRAP